MALPPECRTARIEALETIVARTSREPPNPLDSQCCLQMQPERAKLIQTILRTSLPDVLSAKAKPVEQIQRHIHFKKRTRSPFGGRNYYFHLVVTADIRANRYRELK
jgi:hypothetical protein